VRYVEVEKNLGNKKEQVVPDPDLVTHLYGKVVALLLDHDQKILQKK
jgi:hypothetical protein